MSRRDAIAFVLILAAICSPLPIVWAIDRAADRAEARCIREHGSKVVTMQSKGGVDREVEVCDHD